MALPIKKIYIDTTFKSSRSASNSNFTVDLDRTLNFPENTAFFIDDVCIPHSWYLIDDNVNDKLYFSYCPAALAPLLVIDPTNTGVENIMVKIEAGNYSGSDLAVELQTKIRAYINNPIFPNLLTVYYNAKRNTIIIDPGYPEWIFKLLTPADLINKVNDTWTGASYDTTKTNNMYEIFGNVTDMGPSPWYSRINPYQSNYLNLQPIRNIYIHSSLGNYNTIGARHETSIIKKNTSDSKH